MLQIQPKLLKRSAPPPAVAGLSTMGKNLFYKHLQVYLKQEINYYTIMDELLTGVLGSINKKRFRGGSTSGKKLNINRNHEEGFHRIWNDYCAEPCTYSSSLFNRRFRMDKYVF